MAKCKMCERELENPFDPLSEDCGGDCGYCMVTIEISIGDYNTAIKLLDRMKANLINLNSRRIIQWP